MPEHPNFNPADDWRDEDRTALLEELQQAYLYRDRMSYAPKLDTPDMREQKLAARARNASIIQRLERQRES